MKTDNAKWANFGLVRRDVLAAFDEARAGRAGRGTFLHTLATSAAGQTVDLNRFKGYACDDPAERVNFGRCREPERLRTARGNLPTGVNRTGFIAAMVSIADEVSGG